MKLNPSHDDRQLAGVCGGLAKHFELLLSKLRVVWVLGTLCSAAFPGVFLYLALWYLLPEEAVVFEIGDALSKPKFRPTAIELMTSIFTDPQIKVIPVTSVLVRRAFELFQRRPDKSWGMTDCLSFIVMEDHGIQQALTTDEHFEQAGFAALLRR